MLFRSDRPAPPLYQKAGGFAGNVDRWQIVEHVPPCFSVNFAGCADTGTGAPEGDRRGRRIDLMAVSAPTPETESRTCYYFGFLRSFALDDAETEKLFSVGMVKVFHEDVAVLEAQQRMNTLMPEAPTVSLNVDAAPMAARRLLAQWIRAEPVA